MSRSAPEIQEWMIDRLSRLTGTARQEIDPAKPIQNCGLDSVAQVVFITELETWLDYRFQGHAMNTLTSVEMLAAYLAKETQK